MLLRFWVVATLIVTMSACSSADKEQSAEGDGAAATEEIGAEGGEAAGEEKAAASGDGLSDEPMGDEGVSDAGMNAVTKKSLFERVGGMKALEAFADKFVDALAKHPPLQGNANIVNAMKADQSRHKKLLAEWFCEQTGGPCKYSGREMKSTHAPLKMTATEWTSIRGLFIRTLKELGVQKPERMELGLIAAKQKKNIVSQ